MEDNLVIEEIRELRREVREDNKETRKDIKSLSAKVDVNFKERDLRHFDCKLNTEEKITENKISIIKLVGIVGASSVGGGTVATWVIPKLTSLF